MAVDSDAKAISSTSMAHSQDEQLMHASVASAMSFGNAMIAPVMSSGAKPMAFKLLKSSINFKT